MTMNEVLHVAGPCVPSRASEYDNLEYAQHCTRCGALLSIRIFGYREGALISTTPQSIAMYIGPRTPNCSAVKASAA
jgi:hypothetical protein